jgi:UDP-N-acetylglucosamine--N-acetylmuramyl-(pentapeptide) pyrophosphoryl-undecaprenol N-acetylglucosamine transferase
VSGPVIIACGGTGGHLTPGIALAERLTDAGLRCILLTSHKNVDARLLEKYPALQFRRAPGTGLTWTPRGVLRFAISQARALCFATRLFRAERPSVFVSFGGFLTLGPALASRRAGVPVVLHEANRVPGKAVRLLGKLATRVWLPPGVRLPFAPGVLRHAGFPVRREIAPLPRDAARRALGLPEGGRLLLVLGGSQGAAPLNAWVLANRHRFTADARVLCVCGPEKNIPPDTEHVRFIPFCDRMPEALSAADLALARSGAGSIAEFIACALPSVLVPFPLAADDHQTANARHLAALGAARCITQKNLTPPTTDAATAAANNAPATTADEIFALLQNDAALAAMRAALLAAREHFSWHPLLTDILHLAHRNS